MLQRGIKMKRLALLAFVPLFLCSCSETGNSSDFRIYRDERTGFQTFYESAKSKKEVSYLTVNVLNEGEQTVTLNKTDFKLKFDGKTYDCIFFAEGFKAGYISTNGVTETYSYISSHVDTIDISKAKADESGIVSMENIHVTFDTKPSDSSISYELLYKGTALKTILGD